MNWKTWALTLGLVCVSCVWPCVAQARDPMAHVNRVPLTISVSHLTLAQTQDLRCHSLNIYHEARGTSVTNQVAVAWVVRNRQSRTNQSSCAVIFAPRQFSWTSRRSYAPKEPEAWRRAQELALLVMEDQIPDITRGATHFHENQIRPVWTSRARHTVRIGAHTFHRIEEVAQAR